LQFIISLFKSREDFSGSGMPCIVTNITATYTGSDVLTNIVVALIIPDPFITKENSFIIPTLGSQPIHIPIYFQIGSSLFPNSLKVEVNFAYTNSKGEPRTAKCEFLIPLFACCRAIPTVKNSDYKITIDTNQPPLPPHTLFPDIASIGNDNLATGIVNVLSIKYYSGADVTIVTSKNAGKFLYVF
jgi:hypothetical protein